MAHARHRGVSSALALLLYCTVASVFTASPVAGATLRAQTDVRSNQATVTGRIVSTGTGEPIADAQVSLGCRDQQAKTPPISVSTTTEPDGTFSLAMALNSPSACTVHVSKASFTPPDAASGQHAILGVSLAPGRAVTGVTLALQHGAVVAGQVVDPGGQPLVQARVSAARQVNGRWTMAGGSNATDDLGAFRITGLVPGEYYLVAMPGVGPFTGATPHETTTAPTFYPSALDAASATPVTVTPGRDLTGLLISVRATAAFVISGRLVDSHGRPVSRGSVSLVTAPGSPNFGIVAHAQTDEDGGFTLANIPAGAYTLHGGVPPPPPGGASLEQAALDITIDRANVTGLVLAAKPR